MTISRSEQGSALLLVIGLLMLSVSVLLIGVNVVHYFLNKQALEAALDRSLMISINSYDMSAFRKSGEFLDIALDGDEIRLRFPEYLEGDFPGAEVRSLDIARDSIAATVSFDWRPPFALGGIGMSEIVAQAKIKAQIAALGA